MYIVFHIWLQQTKKESHLVGSKCNCLCLDIIVTDTKDGFLWPVSLTWFNFDPNMDKQSHAW